MARSFIVHRARSLSLFFALALIATASAVDLKSVGGGPEIPQHECDMPAFDPTICSGCTAEAAAYAAAIIDLQDAQALADIAYYEWAGCHQQNRSSEVSAGYSVLVQD